MEWSEFFVHQDNIGQSVDTYWYKLHCETVWSSSWRSTMNKLHWGWWRLHMRAHWTNDVTSGLEVMRVTSLLVSLPMATYLLILQVCGLTSQASDVLFTAYQRIVTVTSPIDWLKMVIYSRNFTLHKDNLHISIVVEIHLQYITLNNTDLNI